MRKLTFIMVLLLGALLLPNASKADSITATATYSAFTSNTLFSAPGKSISFSFNFAGSVIPSNPYSVPITVSYGGNTLSEAGSVVFYAQADGGLVDLYFWSGLNEYLWQFYGSQIFNSSDHLVAGIYPVDVTKSDYQDFLLGILPIGEGSFSSATVIDHAAAVPEPTSLLLLGMGLFGLVPVARKRFFK